MLAPRGAQVESVARPPAHRGLLIAAPPGLRLLDCGRSKTLISRKRLLLSLLRYSNTEYATSSSSAGVGESMLTLRAEVGCLQRPCRRGHLSSACDSQAKLVHAGGFLSRGGNVNRLEIRDFRRAFRPVLYL